LEKKKVPTEAKQRLARLVKDYKVCGFVVSWPLQKDTGRMGASCGRTLYTLEQLLEDTSIINSNRPLCLWDSQHVQPTEVDEFGRSPVFARTSTKTQHVASKEQYHQDEDIVATQVWDDFCQKYWPATDAGVQESAGSSQKKKKQLPSLFASDGNKKSGTYATAAPRQHKPRRSLLAAA
jgi:hypothetical protein